jgi:putative oxidoreductase
MNTLRNIRIFNTTRAEYTKAEKAILWSLQILTALVFLATGSAKLFGNPLMIEKFANLGFGQWFRYATGVIEFFSAVMLLVPQLVPIGAVLLVGTMIGAVCAHLFIIGGSPLVPAILLVFNIGIFLGRSKRSTTMANAL